MVTGAESRDSIVRAIRQWVATLPRGSAEVTEEALAHETVLTIKPSNPRASPIEFRVSDYGTFGLYFGKGFAFEEIPASVDHVLDICDSIRRGRLQERVWEWRGRVVKTEGVLELSRGRLTDRGTRHWAALLGLGTPRLIQYEPWDLPAGDRNAVCQR